MSNSKNSQEEEIDLGSLFKVIARGLSNFLAAVKRVFLAVFHYFILLLLFVKSNIKKLGLAIVIGALIGFVYEYISPRSYSSELIVEPNFGSGAQLYKQIGYLNRLVNKKETLSLTRILQINSEQASQLSSFKITPFQPKRNLYRAYDKYLENRDTIFSKDIKVEDFKERMDECDYTYHEIVVKSESKSDFKLLTSGIIGLIKNDYFNNRKELKKKEINQEIHVLMKNLSQIDSLRALYREVAIKEAESDSSKSTIEFTQKLSEKNKNDIELFDTSNNILKQIRKLNIELIENENIVNIISNFGDLGVIDTKIVTKKYFQFAVVSGGLMLLIILLFQLNKYLTNYKDSY